MHHDAMEIDRRAGILALAQMAEQKAREARIQAEQDLAELIPEKPEGAVSVATENFRVTVTYGMTRSIDQDALEQVRSVVPRNLFDKAITYKPALSVSGLRFIQSNEPETYANLAQAITTKPAKPAVKIVNTTEAALAA